MKNRIKIVGALAFIAIFASGCNDFLDRQPLDTISQQSFYKTDAQVQQGLASTYYKFRNVTIGGMGYASVDGGQNGSSYDIESLTDNAFSSSGWNSCQNYARGIANASTGGLASAMWDAGWKGIAYCNFFLYNLEREEVKAVITTEDYEKYRGEALFNRCYYYTVLLQNFGDLPMSFEPVTADMPFRDTPRSPKSEVYARLMTDIDMAINGLPLIPYSDGHAVKGSAIMLKVRMLMNQHKYAEAATAAEVLINDLNNPHSISDDFAGLFYDDQENNPEIMFSVQYSSPNDMTQFDQYTGARMSCYPIWDLVAEFDKEEDLTGYVDPRRAMTVTMVGDPWMMNPNGATGSFTYTDDAKQRVFNYTAGQFPPRYIDKNTSTDQSPRTSESAIPFSCLTWRKGVNPTEELVNGFPRKSTQNTVLMRYADFLLLYAEAVVERDGGSTTSTGALKAVNEVRTRKGVELLEISGTLTREWIRHERRVELAYEGVRIYDIYRWGIMKDYMPNKVNADRVGDRAGFTFSYPGTDYLPIPLNEITIMGWENNGSY